MIWLIIVGVIFYQGAKRRGLIRHIWALIGVGSVIAGLLVGVGMGWILEHFTNEALYLGVAVIASVIGSISIAYWIMDRYSKKLRAHKTNSGEELLDDQI